MSQLSEMIKKFKLADLVLALLMGDPFSAKRAKYVRMVKAAWKAKPNDDPAEVAVNAVCTAIKKDLVG